MKVFLDKNLERCKNFKSIKKHWNFFSQNGHVFLYEIHQSYVYHKLAYQYKQCDFLLSKVWASNYNVKDYQFGITIITIISKEASLWWELNTTWVFADLCQKLSACCQNKRKAKKEWTPHTRFLSKIPNSYKMCIKRG